MNRLLETVRRNTVPLIVASALFMENMDATALATSLPAIAADLGTSPIDLKLALTSYLLALAVFIPASGWIADRYGAKTVFRWAMLVFGLGSVGCALSDSLGSLVAARVVQGMGGAMMTPVGRLLMLRSIPKSELIGAVAWFTIPALLAPILGPPLGGFITTYFDWRWIFWINIPVVVSAVLLVTHLIPDVPAEPPQSFDAAGFLMVGIGLASVLTGATVAGLDLVPRWAALAAAVAGGVLLALYVRHAKRRENPILDLGLLALPAFRASVAGGLLFRIGIGAAPFLLPLMFQLGFGLSAFQSGMLTFSAGIGAILMKTLAPRILRRFGYRRVLIVNAGLAAVFSVLPAFFTAATPAILIVALFLIGGLSRSLQFTSINTLAFAEVDPARLARATTFTAVLQQLSGSIGVSVAALGLELSLAASGESALSADHFPPVIVAVSLVMAASILAFRRLDKRAGSELLEKPEAREDRGS